MVIKNRSLKGGDGGKIGNDARDGTYNLMFLLQIKSAV